MAYMPTEKKYIMQPWHICQQKKVLYAVIWHVCQAKKVFYAVVWHVSQEKKVLYAVVAYMPREENTLCSHDVICNAIVSVSVFPLLQFHLQLKTTMTD